MLSERNDDDATILEALKTHLSPSAQQSLDALASTSVAVDAPGTDTESYVQSWISIARGSHAEEFVGLGTASSTLLRKVRH
jgi:hypothetical protein